MPAFELFQPASMDDALAIVDRYGSDAWVLGGGLDSFDWLKDRLRRPSIVVDLSRVQGMRGIKEVDGGLEIAAGTTLTEIGAPSGGPRSIWAADGGGRTRRLAANPQSEGTIGGNVSQDTRCWYYRSGWSCYRAGGNICYADTPTAINREHAIFALTGASP